MDGNPEGTPNPLNPVQNLAPASEPEPSTDTAAGTGTLDYIETEVASPTEAVKTTEVVENVNEQPADVNSVAEPASSVAEPVSSVTEPASSVAEPATESKTESAVEQPIVEPARGQAISAQAVTSQPATNHFAARPVHTNYSMADPMMRPVSKPNPTAMGTIVSTAAPVTAAPATATPASTAPIAPTRAESNFDTFAMKDNPSEGASQNVTPTEPNNLVAKDSIVEPAGKKNKKRWLIASAIALIMIAIICGVTAIAIAMLSGGEDRVTKAIDKLLTGQAPNIVQVKGTVSGGKKTKDGIETLLPTNDSFTTIDFDGIFDTKTAMNKIEAKATVSYSEDEDDAVSVTVNEVTTKTGDIYFKVTGISDLLAMTSPGVSYDDILEEVEGQWILLSGDLTDTMSQFTTDSTTTCLIQAVETLPEYSKDIANKYQANPFITASTDNLKIQMRKNNLYKLGFDKAKMNTFSNSLAENGFVKKLKACNGGAEDNDSTLDKVDTNAADLYVEIDENYNFTRVYLDTTMDAADSTSTTKADLNLVYPAELKVTEPTEYVDITTVVSNIMSKMVLNALSTYDYSDYTTDDDDDNSYSGDFSIDIDADFE